jgi:hypothetical protein
MNTRSRLFRGYACAALVVGGAVVIQSDGAAQRPGAWFGTIPIPRGLSDPHKAIVDVTSVRPAPLVLPSDDTLDGDLTGPVIYKDLERIVGFSRENQASGDRAWGRITGFSGAANAYAWAATRFRDAGLKNVELQEYDGAAPGMWQATSWDVRVLPNPHIGGADAPVILGSAIPTAGSVIQGGSLTAAVVDAGAVDKPVDQSLDVTGKIAVQFLRSGGSAYAARTNVSTRARELTTMRGAAAVMTVVDQTANMYVRDFGNCGGPCFNVGAEDGRFLEGVLRASRPIGAEIQMQLTLDAATRSGLKGHNVIGIVQGRNDAENIIVNAHGDGWFEAAGDNGDGFATVLALARYFAKPEHQPARTLVFVISGGHHSTGLNGPQNLVRMNKALLSKTVMVVNLEHIAQLAIHQGSLSAQGPPSWLADAAEQQMGFAISNQSPFLIDLGHRARDRYHFNIGQNFGSNVPGDLGGYEPLGVARVQAIHSGPMYHTSGDTLDTISLPGLERAARFFAYFVSEAAKAPTTAINPRP